MMVIVSTHPIASTSPIRIIRFLPWCIVHLPIDSSTSSSPANSCRTISSWRNFIFKTSSYRRNLISKTSSCRRNIISKISSCRRNLISKISSCRRNLISQTSMCRRIRASRIFLPSMTTNLLRRHCLTTNSSSAAVASVPWISPLQILRKEPDLPPQSTSNVDSSDHNRWRRSYILHSTAIQMITTSRDAQLALDIFNHAGSQSGFNHNNETYAAILNRLARSQKFLAIDALLVRMRQEPCRFNEAVILNLMPYFSRASLCDKTLDLFHAIPSLARSKPSMKAFSTCLNNLVVHGRFDLAERLISDADKKYNLTPNVCIYNILIKHHCKVGDLDSGFAVLDSIRDSQDFPNLITYSTLISGLCSSGRLKDAFKVFEEMNERDKITPDAMIYNILINGFCRNSMTDKAATMLGFMRANGCEPNIVNYSTLMIGYCRENRYDKALAVFNSIPTHNLKPDTVCYTTLISYLCKCGRTNEAIKLANEMGRQGPSCRPDLVTLNSVISGLSSEKRYLEVVELVESVVLPMPFAGVRPNKASYRIVMNWLCKDREMEIAMRLVRVMIGRRVLPHFKSSNELLVGLCESEMVADASLVLTRLVALGFEPEVGTWSRLVEGVCRERKRSKAVGLFEELVINN